MTESELRAICTVHGISVSLTGLVREADAARLLGLDVRTLRRWRADGHGPRACRLRQSWRYSLVELAAVLTPPDKEDKSKQGAGDSSIDDATPMPNDAATLPRKAVAS
jgi:hypothetical protein